MVAIERKAAIVRGCWNVAILPVLVYLELRERFEYTDWKW